MTDNTNKYGLMRKGIELNAPVTITLPAHVWHGYWSAYGAAKWGCSEATAIMMEVRDAMFDPVWLKEREADTQRKHDEHHRQILGSMFSGLPGIDMPDIPPDAGDLPPSD